MIFLFRVQAAPRSPHARGAGAGVRVPSAADFRGRGCERAAGAGLRDPGRRAVVPVPPRWHRSGRDRPGGIGRRAMAGERSFRVRQKHTGALPDRADPAPVSRHAPRPGAGGRPGHRRRAALADRRGKQGCCSRTRPARCWPPRVEDEIIFGLENLGLPRREIAERLEAALTRFGLAPLRDRVAANSCPAASSRSWPWPRSWRGSPACWRWTSRFRCWTAPPRRSWWRTWASWPAVARR